MPATMTNKVPIVQFASQIMYTSEGSASHSRMVQVMRIGGLSETCEVGYEMEDKSWEGIKFHRCEGTLTFGPNESTKSFELLLIENDSFDSVVELPIVLKVKSNCVLGAYLYRTRVKIIDDDTFPTSKFETETRGDYSCDSWKKGHDFRMLWQFFKLCYIINTSGAIWVLMGDQIDNGIFIFQLWLGKTLITALSDETSPWANEAGVIHLAIMLTAPYAYTHLFHYRKQFWKIGGSIRKQMLKDLLMRSLYYEEATRDEVNATEVKETFAHHIFRLVTDGYMKVFEVAAAVGRLIMLLIFFLYNAIDRAFVLEKGPELFYFIVIFFITPLLTLIYVRIRIHESNRCREETEDSKVDLVDFMESVNDSYRVVADCWARPIVLSGVLEKINAVNKNLVRQGARDANDRAFFGWTSELMDGFVIILGGMMVLSKSINLPLGVFTATLAGLRGSNGQYLRIYKAVLAMQSTFPALWLLVEYMNHPMDLVQRLHVVEETHKQWPERFALAQRDPRVVRGEMNAEDAMTIVLKDVEFGYKVNLLQKLSSRATVKARASDMATAVTVLKRVNLEIPQGKIIGITGPSGHGKGTLLRVLAEVLIPTSGGIFVPSHLRVLHVELQDVLYEGSVAFNVFFALLASRGLKSTADLKQEELDRGVRVCKALAFDPQVIEAVQNHAEMTGTHLKSLSQTTRIRIQLARALVVNPEVLVLHMPMDFLRTNQAQVVMDQLKAFVFNKGVELPPDDAGFRRPRTCIFTSNHHHFLSEADIVWSVVEGEMYHEALVNDDDRRNSKDYHVRHDYEMRQEAQPEKLSI